MSRGLMSLLIAFTSTARRCGRRIRLSGRRGEWRSLAGLIPMPRTTRTSCRGVHGRRTRRPRDRMLSMPTKSSSLILPGSRTRPPRTRSRCEILSFPLPADGAGVDVEARTFMRSIAIMPPAGSCRSRRRRARRPRLAVTAVSMQSAITSRETSSTSRIRAMPLPSVTVARRTSAASRPPASVRLIARSVRSECRHCTGSWSSGR